MIRSGTARTTASGNSEAGGTPSAATTAATAMVPMSQGIMRCACTGTSFADPYTPRISHADAATGSSPPPGVLGAAVEAAATGLRVRTAPPGRARFLGACHCPAARSTSGCDAGGSGLRAAWVESARTCRSA